MMKEGGGMNKEEVMKLEILALIGDEEMSAEDKMDAIAEYLESK